MKYISTAKINAARARLMYAKEHEKGGVVEINVDVAKVILDVLDAALLAVMDNLGTEPPRTRKPRRTKAELSVVRSSQSQS